MRLTNRFARLLIPVPRFDSFRFVVSLTSVRMAERHRRGKAGRPANRNAGNRTITVTNHARPSTTYFRREGNKKHGKKYLVSSLAEWTTAASSRSLHSAFPSCIR